MLLSAGAATAQETTQDELNAHGIIKRGAELGDAPLVSLHEVFESIDELAGEIVTVLEVSSAFGALTPALRPCRTWLSPRRRGTR